MPPNLPEIYESTDIRQKLLLAEHIDGLIDSWCKKNGEKHGNSRKDGSGCDYFTVRDVTVEEDFSRVYKTGQPNLVLHGYRDGAKIFEYLCSIKQISDMEDIKCVILKENRSVCKR